MANKKPTIIENIRNEIKNIIFSINKDEDDNYIYLSLVFDDYKFPVYKRNRNKGTHNYDPHSKWKSCFHERFDKEIQKIVPIPYDGYVDISITRYIKAPKDILKSKKKCKEILSGKLRPRVRPDNDNIEKIIFDLFNKVIYLDDNQIVDNNTHKRYAFEDKTIIEIKIEK